MIPFTAWSQSKTESEGDSSHSLSGDHSIALLCEVEIELTSLMTDLIEDLMTSNVVQLNSAFETVGKKWAEQQTNQQEDRLRREMAKLEEDIVSIVADALSPILTEYQTQEVVKEFAATLQKLLPEFEHQKLMIKAPADIHEMLRQALQNQSVVADLDTSVSREITIVGNQVALRADLDSWSQKLKELVIQ